MKIVVCGSYGAKNLGDEMILEGLLTSLRSVVPQAEITVLTGNPKETLERYGEKFGIKVAKKFAAGIKSFALSGSATSKIVKECDWFILGGGGLFGGLNFRANLIWAIQALMAYRFKKPVIMYGQSIGEVRWKIIRWLMRKIFQKAELIAVRDEDSKEQLKKLGVKKKIYLVPDLGFRLSQGTIPTTRANTPTTTHTHASTQSTTSIFASRPTLLVALRQMPDLSQHFKHYIAEFLDWLISEHNYKIKFIDFQQGKEGDDKLHKEIAAMMKTKFPHGSSPEITPLVNATRLHIDAPSGNHTIADLLHEFSRADLILGMRLHSIITAIKTKTPFIAISYAPKVSNFLQTASLQKYSINHDVLDFEKLKSIFERIEKDRMDIKKELEGFNAWALRDCLKFEEDILKKIIN